MKERIVRAVAGTIVLISMVLSYFGSINWLWLGVFVGMNLLQSSFTKFCPLEKILNAVGVEDKPSKKYRILKNPANNCIGEIAITASIVVLFKIMS